ncbi:MAG: hypothetical protein WD068_00950 [Candidatus Babeliales bacterium]
MHISADALKRMDRTQKIISLTVIGFIGASIGGYLVYRPYIANREQQAHVRFVDSMEIYLQAQAAGQDKDKKKYQQGLYEEAELAFHAGSDQHASSYLSPYFIALQASAMLQQGKRDEALVLYEKAYNSIPTRSPVRNLFAIQLALIQIDDEKTSVNGVKSLQSLASDTANQYQDLAQFYLGQYYWSRGEIEEAKTVWLKLIEDQHQYGDASSPWAQLASMRITENS